MRFGEVFGLNGVLVFKWGSMGSFGFGEVL